MTATSLGLETKNLSFLAIPGAGSFVKTTVILLRQRQETYSTAARRSMSAMAAKGSKSTESDAFIPLPDPYGEGFEYSEDPIENTRNQWSVLEKPPA